MLEFGKFCKEIIIMDKVITLSVVDRLFVAVNFEDNSNGYEGEDNPDKLLCRYEFLEILIRLAGEKYIKTGKTTSQVDAFNTLL